MYHSTRKILASEISGASALGMAAAIYHSDRRNNYAAFRETADLAAAIMRRIGLADVDMFVYPADGVTKQGDWVPPQAWDIASGRLELIEPGGQARILTDYADDPLAVALYSAPTPARGVEGRVVVWEDLSRPAAGKGKIVLTSLPVSAIFEQAYAVGVRGIISDATRHYWQPDQKMDVPDAAYWENAAFVPFNRQDGWAFILSPRKGELLRARIKHAAGPVRLRARIDSRLYNGTVGIPSGIIPGTDLADEEVVLLSHMYEIGAADNASGCGASLEAARAIVRLISEGRLPPPRRTIRILPVYEIYGTIAYYNAHQALARRTMAGLNLDMVGEDMAKTGAFLQMVRTPASNPSFTNDLMEMLLADEQKRWPQLRWKPVPFGLMDNVLSDPQVNIPTPSLYYGDDRFYHTAADTPDKLDPRAMGSAARCGAAYAYFCASAGPAEAVWMAARMAERANCRLTNAAEEILSAAMAGRKVSSDEDLNARLAFLKRIEVLAVRSCSRLVARDERFSVRKHIQAAAAAVKGIDPRSELRRLIRLKKMKIMRSRSQPFPRALVRKASGMVPERTLFGVLTMGDLKSPGNENVRAEFERTFRQKAPGYCLSGEWTHALFYADGKRDVAAIAELVRHAAGSCDLKRLIQFFCFAVKHGYCELNTH